MVIPENLLTRSVSEGGCLNGNSIPPTDSCAHRIETEVLIRRLF